MPIQPISSAQTTATATTRPAGVDMGNGLDTNSFLQLLVTQLKYQNPTEPMDPSELMNSTAQLTLVDKLNELLALQKSDGALARAALANSLIGKQVSYLDPRSNAAASGVVQAVKISGETLVVRVNNREIEFTKVTEIAPAA